MTEPKRPTVGFQLEIHDGGTARLVDADGGAPWFPFPGGADWTSAVSAACIACLSVAPESIAFDALVDAENREETPDAWIGVRFRVRVPSATTAPPSWRWR